MKKRGILALLLACSFALGTASMTACDLIGGAGGGEGTGTEQGTGNEGGNQGGNQGTGNQGGNQGTGNEGENQGGNQGTGNQGGNQGGEGEEQKPTTVSVTGVTLKTSTTLKVGATEKLTAQISPSNATNQKVSWSTDKPAIATVVDGLVTAKSVGSAVITVTTEDGNKTAKCTVTVEAASIPVPSTVKVTGVTLDKSAATLKPGEKLTLNETVSPADATNKAVTWTSSNTAAATVDGNGVVTAVAAGQTTITVKTSDGNFTANCAVTVQQPASQPVVDAKISYTYAGNECVAFEWSDSNASGADVEYRLKGASSYTKLSGNDKQYLIRQKNPTTARVDLVGLQGGAVYEFKITTSAKEVLTASDVTVNSHDRSGYAHFGKSDGVGAYKDNGTPKDNAVIVYVNEANKNTVKATVNGKERTGIVEILQNAGTSKPLIVRVVGTVGAATWNTLAENNGKELTPDKVVGVNGKKLVDFYGIERSTYNSSTKKYEGGKSKDLTQATLIKDGFNTLNTSDYSELIGLTSKAKYDASKDEFDSCWNDCPISGVKNVTVEGIGEDAEIFQWGMTFKNSSSIEVRNLHFDDYTEDACSFEGSESGATELSGFKSGNIWLHHNTFDEGKNYWDVCNEQDKHDGDGSTDFKGIKNITIAYNHYISTHKTNLIGGGDSHATANVTFHHNYYQSCNQRMPLGRQANMHMYNNYYSGSTLYSISLRAGAYAFIENCYFTEDASNHYPVELVKGSSGTPSAKIINCVIDKNKVNDHNKVGDANLYIGTDRSHKMNNASTDNETKQRFAPDFDTNSSLFYYKDGKSDVSVMFTAEETKTYIPKLAGVQKHGEDVTLGGAGGSTGGGTETPDPNPGGDETGDLVLGNPSSLTAGALAAGSTQTFGGIKLYGSGKLSVIEGNNTIKYNGENYTSSKYISLGGGANFEGNEACVEFTVTGNCKLTVATRSSGAARTLKVVGGAEDLTIDAPDKSAAIAVTTVNLSAGTYKIGSSSGGINIYYIIIENLA